MSPKDPAHQADDLVREGFSPYFGERLPPCLGSETYCTTFKRLHNEGFGDVEHAQEVFARALTNGLDHLHNHGGLSVRQPRAWFHAICRHETYHYLRELAAGDAASVELLVEGETVLPKVELLDQKRVLALVHEAMKELAPRHREFILLDFVEQLPPEEIQRRMHIQSYGYFKKLKHQALSALKLAVKALLEHGISSLL